MGHHQNHLVCHLFLHRDVGHRHHLGADLLVLLLRERLLDEGHHRVEEHHLEGVVHHLVLALEVLQVFDHLDVADAFLAELVAQVLPVSLAQLDYRKDCYQVLVHLV